MDDPLHIFRRGMAAGMKAAGLRRNAIARRLGVTRQTLYRWERLDLPREPVRASDWSL